MKRLLLLLPLLGGCEKVVVEPPPPAEMAACMKQGLEYYRDTPDFPWIRDKEGRFSAKLVDEHVMKVCRKSSASYGTDNTGESSTPR